jgi:ADP-ribose pyrophosphatase
LPAGTVDPGEELERAALRECHEEIGKIADRVRKLASFYPSPGFCDERMNFFLLTELRDRRPDEAAAAQDPDELLTVKAFSISEARSMVARGEIVDMKTALGLSLLPAML